MGNRFTESPASCRSAAESAARARSAAALQRIAAANMLRGESAQDATPASARRQACESFWRYAGAARAVSPGN